MTLTREHELIVSGVVENVPANSTLQFDMIVPMAFRIATAGASAGASVCRWIFAFAGELVPQALAYASHGGFDPVVGPCASIGALAAPGA